MALAAALVAVAAGARPSDGGEAHAEHTAELAAQLATDSVFRHASHSAYGCVQCHSSGGDHRDLRVRTLADCRACHHAAPVAEPCARCHDDAASSERLLTTLRTLSFPQGRTATRALPFVHGAHEGVACATCHAPSPARSARAVDCVGCHAEHHGEGADCSACHVQAPAAVHPLTVHAGCTGAGCHADAPLAALPQLAGTRSACLVCHQDRAEHRPGQPCADCHVLPPPALPGAIGLAHPGGWR